MDIINLVEEAAFNRIADYLLRQAPGPTSTILVTQQQIASDLGTSR